MQMPTKEEIAAMLREAADHVEKGDSYEGTIAWSLIDESIDVRYRVGNLNGQGGMVLLQVEPTQR